MRVIIRCAGSGERWSDYRGVPKHLVPIRGEPVLHRTVRLVSEITPDADVKIVVESLADRRYLVAGSSRTVDKPDPSNGDLDKIASSRHLWAKDRTVLLWGDTWWSRSALSNVLTAEVEGWRAWGRLGSNGHGGELFAFAFTDNSTVGEALDRALEAQHAGLLHASGHNGDSVRGGWALLRSLCGLPCTQHGPYRNLALVDDWTEDMDAPRDWDEWCLRYAQTDPTTREEMTR